MTFDPKPPALRPLPDRLVDALLHRMAKDERAAKPYDWLAATILTVRDQVIDQWMASTRAMHAAGAKRVYYLSLEFLIGRLLRDALSNLGLTAEMEAALAAYGVDLAQIEELEPDAALGNGGLGRLAACFMESLASLDLPACGYGIRYINGMFRQRIKDGWQLEYPETWLAHGNHWEFERRETAYLIGFGGEVTGSEAGHVRWMPAEVVRAEAIDTPVVGWRGKRVNTLRLWNALALDPIRLDAFNAGDHLSRPGRRSARGAAGTRALSGRLHAGGTGTAPAPGIFLRQRLHPGHRPPPYPVFQGHQDAAAKGGDPSQRHPPRRGGHGIDAPSDRPA